MTAHVVHGTPMPGEAVTPCCGRLVFELPRGDRMSTDQGRVNCWTGDDPRLKPRSKTK